jgi:hypothetical protein
VLAEEDVKDLEEELKSGFKGASKVYEGINSHSGGELSPE